jgi:hypothetical protein
MSPAALSFFCHGAEGRDALASLSRRLNLSSKWSTT